MWLCALLLSCTLPPAPPNPLVNPHSDDIVAEPIPYSELLDGISADRAALSARYREASAVEKEALKDEARTLALQAMTREIFPRWDETPWAFYGTTTTPGKGEIACGYFVSTTLVHAGFEVERVKLAQQASEKIVKTLVPKDQIRRFRDKPISDVVDAVKAGGEGLYVLGLDWHVSYLWNDGSEVWMCHSSPLGGDGVRCEAALTAEAMASRYHVMGKLFADPMIEAWLDGDAIPTR